ncbi:MobF family relaxase [Leucobacter musarum]|uniref:MobF family relaxase n=1 Tax=Leucobacter musarum TaxID=1930747 RepID=UPI0006A7DCE4|nr:MobF family relaxase [Leucobacter musarum]
MITVTLIGASRDAWGYLMNTVATEHTIDRAEGKAAYYMANGTPPGNWAGAGIAALGLNPRDQVEERELVALFGAGEHPVTGAKLGRKYHTPLPLEQRIQQKIQAAAADPANRDLTPAEFDELGDRIRKEVAEEKVPQSVAGFEFVFSPPKSVSSWWALADPELKDQIRQAHQSAIQATIEKLETDIVRTRTGADGVAQSHVLGISAALFDHWDSREGDPQLHTHMLVSNRVQGEDGRWRTIDSRYSLMPAVATASAYYDSVLMDELSARFGVEWTVEDVLQDPEQYRKWLTAEGRPDTPAARQQFAIDLGTNPGSVKWQIDGVPQALVDEYSTRAKQVNRRVDQVIAKYVKEHGRRPSDRTIIQMRQQATLTTRRAKGKRSLRDLTQNWRHRATPHVGDSFLFADRLHEAGAERQDTYPLWSFRHDDVDDDAIRDAAEFALHLLATQRSTWGKRNAETAALRAIAGWRFRSANDRDQTARRIVDVVLSQAIPLTPKNPLRTPNRFRTADGEDMFHPEARDLYTAPEVWDAEERLLNSGMNTSAGIRTEQALVDEHISQPTGSEQRILSSDQAAAVENLLTSGRQVDVLVGPAGAGKTTSLEKLREIWERQFGAGSVRGLAPTARAAEVLAESLEIITENTAKWLHETARGTTTKDGFSYELHAGDLMIVDEASIAGTIALDQLRAQADAAGAKLLLVGDWAQLASVDAGGAFGLLASDRPDVAELINLHRFKAEWEADASKLLRLGKTSGLDPYIDNGRITAGLDETIVAEAVDAWKQDEATPNATGDAGLVSLLIAPTNEVVERLNDIARDWRIQQGHVDPTQEATIKSGVASPGDRIVTRQNARTLRTDHDRWVKNNDEWVVAGINPDTGDIVATAGEEWVTLPADYCRDHVQLAYATTAHRSQGRTVDTAHTIVDSSATRETFYVAMTRGQLSNRAYVVADENGDMGDPSAFGMSRTWRETLEHVVTKKGGDVSAHESLQEEADRIGSIRQLAAEYQTLIADQLEREYIPVLAGLDLVDPQNPESPYLGPVLANLRRLETRGKNVPETVTALLAQKDLGDARDVLAVLHYRLNTHLEDLREHDTYDHYAPLYRSFGLDPTGSRSELFLGRTLAALEATGEVVLEDALRSAREQVLLEEAARKARNNGEQVETRDVPARITQLLRKAYGVVDLDVPDEVRALRADAHVAGLIERAPDFGEPDFTAALTDRELAIQLRAEYVVDQAIQDEAPWLRELGEMLPGGESEWRRRAVTVACYRDLYGVDTDEALGREHAHARNRERDRQIAAAALHVRATPVREVPLIHSQAAPHAEQQRTVAASTQITTPTY